MEPDPIGFALGIRTKLDPDGKIMGYQVQSETKGLPDEMIITIVRNWFRMVEENYYNRFSGEMKK